MIWPELFLVASATLAAAFPLADTDILQARNTGTCSSNEFVPVQSSGAASIGTPFCETGWGSNYIPVTGIETWSEEYYINGMQFHYADGSSSSIYGTTDGSTLHQLISVDYSKGERWKSFDLYSHTDPNTLNTIDIFNSNGDELYAGASQASFAGAAVHTNQPVGSGILFGAMGTSDGTSLRDLGLLLLASPISSIRIDSIEYPDGPNGDDGISIDNIAEGHYFNDQTSGNITWTFEDQKAVTNTYAFQQTTADMYGTSESIMFGLNLKIISFGSTTQFMWSQTYTQSSTNTVATATTVSWSASGSLEPQTGVDTLAIVGQSSGSFPYTSTVTISLQDGTQFTYSENGYTTVNEVSQAIVQVSTDDNAQ